MFRSLSSRLLAAVGVVVVTAVAAVGFFTSRATRVEFEAYRSVEARAEIAMDPETFRRPLLEHHDAEGTWEGAGPILRDICADQGFDGEAILVGRDGTVVASDPAWIEGKQVGVGPDGGLTIQDRASGPEGRLETELRIQGGSLELVGTEGVPLATVFPLPSATAVDEEVDAAFIRSVDRWLVIAVAAAGLMALIATGFIARRMLGPVRALTAAARRMEEGDLTSRVDVAGPEEIAGLGAAFNAMAGKLRDAETRRRQMVGDVAHELRTPLTNLRCHLEAMEDGLLQPDPGTLASLQEETLLLGRLVDDLQDLYLAEAGTLHLSLAALDPGREVNAAVGALPAMDEAPPVELRVDDLPPVLADTVRFRQILRNLLTNAFAHTPASGTVTVAGRAAGDAVEFSVRDTGAGIAPDHLPHVFERFYRTDASRDRNTGGAGLGLAIVKHLVTIQGGTIEVASEEGRGTEVRFTLPAASGPGPGAG